jgi:hypothetical protein
MQVPSDTASRPLGPSVDCTAYASVAANGIVAATISIIVRIVGLRRFNACTYKRYVRRPPRVQYLRCQDPIVVIA